MTKASNVACYVILLTIFPSRIRLQMLLAYGGVS